MRTLRRSQGNFFFLWRCLLAGAPLVTVKPPPFAPQLPLGPSSRNPNHHWAIVPDACRAISRAPSTAPRALHFAFAYDADLDTATESTIEPAISPVDSISPSLPTPRCGLPVCISSDTLANMSAYYESSQWAPSGQAGWDHQTPPPARSGTFFP